MSEERRQNLVKKTEDRIILQSRGMVRRIPRR